MKKVFSNQDLLLIGHLKNILEMFGIECMIKNLYLASAAGELPPIECWPELWVVDDSRYAEAQVVLKRNQAKLESIKEPWKCGRCGEDIEGQFSECWNCGECRNRQQKAKEV